MEPLEALVDHIQGLSSTAGDLNRLHTILKQADESLRADTARLSSVLTQLNPSVHSLGFLYIRDASAAGPFSKEQAETVVPTIARFITACAQEQIRLAPDKFISVCKRLKDQVMLLEASIRGEGTMRTALRKLQISTKHLTPLRPEFLTLCLLAKCYKTGLLLLEDDVFEVNQPKDPFFYCYYERVSFYFSFFLADYFIDNLGFRFTLWY